MTAASTRIIGVGNPLMGDDGLGVAFVVSLTAVGLPDQVEAIDGGIGGLTLLDLMAGARTVILVDAVDFGAPPGTVRRFPADEILLSGSDERPLSLHASGIEDVLALGRELGILPPEFVLYGVQPLRVEPSLGLSPVVAGTIPALIDAVLREIERF